MGTKNKSASKQEKSQNKDSDSKSDKSGKGPGSKIPVSVVLNEKQAEKYISSSKVITIFDMAKQTNVKISTANAYLKKALEDGKIKRVGGFSGHHIYQPA